MAASIGTLILDLRASTDGFSKDAAKAVQKARRMGNDIAKAIAIGAAAVGAGLSVVVKEANERIDALAKSADRMGIPIERLRAIQEVGDKAGVSIESTNAAMQQMQKNVFLAAAGSEKAGYGFRALGLNVKEMLALSPDKQFDKVSDALGRVENQTAKAGIATKIFGDAGAAMLNVMKDGSAAMDEADKKLRSLGVTVSRIDAAKIEIANDAMSDLKLIAEGAGNQLAIALAPILAGISQQLLKLAGDTKGFSDWILKLVEWGVTGVGYLADAFRGWQVIIKAGEIAFIAMYSAIDWVFKNIKVAVLSVGAVIAESLRGWQMISKVVEIAFYTVMDATKGAIQPVLDFVLAGVNKLIVTINSLAGTKFDQVKLDLTKTDWDAKIAEAKADLAKLSTTPTGTSKALDSAKADLAKFNSQLRAGTDQYSAAIKSTWGELEKLLLKQLPSDQLQQWLAKVRAATTATAKGIAESTKPIFQPEVKVEPLKELHGYLWDILDTSQLVFNGIEDVAKSMSDSIGKLVRGTMTWNEALLEISNTIITSVLSSLIQMAAQWLASQIAAMVGIQTTQAATMAASTSATLASAQSIQAAWIPAAIAASIATYGTAAWTGLGSFIAATALGTAAAVGIGAIGSYAGAALNASASSSGARAQGGRVNSGSLYQVNEKGVEMFRPDVSGEVIPMGKYEKDMNGGSGGQSINITQTFTGGVTERDLATQAAKTKRETIEAVVDGINRGGQFRKAMHK